jgi:hypothetical protein
MKRPGLALVRVVPTIIILSAIAIPALGQSIWLPRDRNHAILLEVLHPSMEYSNPDVASGALFLGGRVRLGGSVDLLGELPYAIFEGTYAEGYWFSQEVSSSMVGNPYLGLEVDLAGPGFFVELGARAPLGADDEYVAPITGVNADRTRFDAFARHTVPIHGVLNFRRVDPSGLSTRLRLGAILAIDTEYRAIEVHAVFAWMIGYEGETVRVGSAISGTSLVSEDSGNVGARTRTQLELHADLGRGTIRPGIEVKLPIDSSARNVPIVLGFSLGASF